MSRSLPWYALIALTLVSVIVAIVFGGGREAWACGITGVLCMVIYGMYSSWRYGLRRHVEKHLGRQWDLGEVLKIHVRTVDRANYQLALDWLQSQSTTPGPFGARAMADADDDNGTGGYVAEIVALIEGNPEPVAIVWERMPTSIDQTMNCAANALYLLNVEAGPVAVLVQQRGRGVSKRAVLQILARTEAIAQAAQEQVNRLAREQSVYRGQVISVERPKDQQTDLVVSFHDIGQVARERIVLPPEVQSSIDRNIVAFFRHADALRAAGQGTRHGVLLHGPPGTGKTLVTRYLATSVGATVLLVTGKQYAQLRAVCQLARVLSPSLVILEDVDLIAGDRRTNRRTPLLHELLDEMDGLGSAADIVFLLTTNRPEVLEAAVAARPGRIDQAIYFPLPDLECRRRLFAEFSTPLDVRGIDFEGLLRRTEGASPAFLKEFFRRAALNAILRGEKAKPPRLTPDDFEQGLRELLQTGGELTRAFLGFPTAAARD